MPKRKKHLPLMVVLWRDHSSSHDWLDADQIAPTAEPPIMHSIGWLCHEDKDKLVLCATIDESDGTVGQMMSILKGGVVKKRIIPQPKGWK